MYTIEFYNTKMNLICTKKADFKQSEAMMRNCKSCGCVFDFNEDTDVFRIQGTKADCEELMYWAYLR